MIELKKNDTVQVEITDLSKEGMGIGRVEGIVVLDVYKRQVPRDFN